MRLRTIYLIFSVLALLVGFSRHYYEKGLAEAQLACEISKSKTAQSQLSHFINASKEFAANANTASNVLSELISTKTEADQKSTKEIRYVLKTSTDNRCQYPADLMQQLNDARLRANHAATSGLGYSLSATGSARK